MESLRGEKITVSYINKKRIFYDKNGNSTIDIINTEMGINTHIDYMKNQTKIMHKPKQPCMGTLPIQQFFFFSSLSFSHSQSPNTNPLTLFSHVLIHHPVSQFLTHPYTHLAPTHPLPLSLNHPPKALPPSQAT